jgi:hypothetical protein
VVASLFLFLLKMRRTLPVSSSLRSSSGGFGSCSLNGHQKDYSTYSIIESRKLKELTLMPGGVVREKGFGWPKLFRIVPRSLAWSLYVGRLTMD